MNLWHLTPDAPRRPQRVSPDERVDLTVGSWPVEPGQAVWVVVETEHPDGASVRHRAEATWLRNDGSNSYWSAMLGPFGRGDRVRYTVRGRSRAGEVTGPSAAFTVGARLHLALLWHQHQPLYKDAAHPGPRGSYRQPWVRLHALRDYYSMAALVAEHPALHLTINLTPVLLAQLTDYLEEGATDEALELTLRPAETLGADERAFLLDEFFDADWHNQIYRHARYKQLFEKRAAQEVFSAQDLRDLQMWFNLAWFALEFRTSEVTLATGEVASVRRFVEQGEGFSVRDVEAMVAEQYKVMRAVIPLHRQLQDEGRLEVTTTPFYHPILPLLIDTDRATLDRPGATHPKRFAYPEDAEAQVARAVLLYQHHFGRPPRGMWPAEGAVSQSAVPLFARHGVRWVATDQGVLARSGRWGYDADDPEVLCRPYRAEEEGAALSLFFRDARLSDEIGFHYGGYSDYGAAARDFVRQIRERFAERLPDAEAWVLTLVLDGENAWGAYREDARPFLHALYGELEAAGDLVTATFSECLSSNPERGLAGMPLDAQPRVYDLFTGSWIDENGSAPGVDLGTWLGEEEENRAWALLGEAREALTAAGATPHTHPEAFEALYSAEGSDWFWWFGEDQDSGSDAEFDSLFRAHLRNVYLGLGLEPPAHLEEPIVPRRVLWRWLQPAPKLVPGDRLTVQTHSPGVLRWGLDGEPAWEMALTPVGGVMAGVQRFEGTLGPLPPGTTTLHVQFRCTHPACDGQALCCRAPRQRLRVAPASGATGARGGQPSPKARALTGGEAGV